MTSDDRNAARIAMAMFVMCAIANAFSYDTIGVFLLPLAKHFNLARAQASGVATALMLGSGVSLPIVGLLMDRFDAKVVMTSGAVLAILGYLLAGSASSFPIVLFSYGLIGIGIAFTTVVPTSVIITNWYGERRGTAMGFAFSGFALGEMLGNISAGFIVPHYGWRAGYLVSAVITAAIMIPVILLAIRTRPNTALENKGAQTEPTAIGSSAAFSWTCFASLLLLYFFYACVISVLIVHGVPYLISLGYAPERAAALFGLMLGCSFFGRNLAGILADKFGAVEALCGILVLIAASFIAFIFADRTSFLIIAMAGSALFCFSAPPVIPLLQAELLGVKNFGVLTGFLNTSSTIGYSIGPLFAGRVFDLTGRYDRAFEVAAACTLLGIGATLSARRCAVKDFSPSPSKEIKSSA